MSFRSSKRYTAVQATELILADSVDDSEPLSDYHLMVKTAISCNIINHTESTSVVPEAISSSLDAFELTFSPELGDTIMHYTNQR